MSLSNPHRRPLPRRHALAIAAAAALGPLAAAPASAAVCTWDTTSGNWSAIANWLACAGGNGNPAQTPGSNDTANIGSAGVVTIDTAQSVLNLNNAGQINLDAFSLTLVGGGSTVNTGIINVGGATAAALQMNAGHNMNNAGGTINIGAGSVFNQLGGTISGGTVNAAGSGRLAASASANNFIDGLTLNGTLDLASAYGVERVVNGLTLNGSVNIAQGSIFAPQGNQTIGGSGAIVFADGNASNRLNVEAGNLTLGAGVTVRGEAGFIGQQAFAGGGATLTNQGKIAADVAGATITLGVASGVTNTGTLQGNNGGTLQLNQNGVGIANTGGTIRADNAGVVLFNGVTIDGGTLATGSGGRLVATGSGNNFLNNTALAGVLDLATAYGVQRVSGGMVLDGTVTIGNNSILAPQGDQTIGGTGAIVFADSNGSNRLNVEAGNLVLGSGITVHGNTGYIGQQVFVGGAASLTNHGTISADGGGTITLGVSGPVTNTGTLSAVGAGSVLLLNSSVANTLGSQILATGGGKVIQNGVTLNGVVNVASGAIGVSGSTNNFFDNVSFSGALDLASTYGVERVVNGLTLNGSVNIAQASIFAPQGDQTIGGSGTIVFADSNASNRLNTEAGNLTLGAGITVRGETGYIGSQNFVGGAATLTNNGTIQADVAGGAITLAVNGGVINNGTLAAKNGGTLLLNNNVNNIAGSQILAGAGSTVLQNGVTLNGAINVNGTGTFRASASGSNFLDNATFTGTLDLATAYGTERVANGLALDGTVNIAQASIFAPQGDQTIGGNGAIVFADGNASNRFNTEAGSLTLGAGITVRGEAGTIGQQTYLGGAATLINNGTIQADVSGGAINVAVNGGITNTNVMQALNGGTLQLSTAIAQSGAGRLSADSSSVVLQSGVAISGGAFNGTGRLVATANGNNFLDAFTLNGTLDLATSYGVERVTNGLALNGSVKIAQASILAPQGDQTISGSGAIVFADGSSNRLNVEAGNLVLGPNITVHGNTGYIGAQNWVGGAATLTNRGVINSDGGGTITLAVSGTTTNEGTMRAQNGTLVVSSALVNHGTLQADAAGVVSLPTPFANDGLMTGVGKFTLAGTLTNNGHVKPGTPGGEPGALTLEGSYAQGAAGWFDVGLDGANFGSLAIGGSAALDGTIGVICEGACDYAAGTSWIVMTTGGSNLVTGAFAGPVAMSGFSAGAFSVTYLSNQVILNVTEATVGVVPEPATYAMLLAGLAVLGGVARRRRGA